MLFPLRQSLAHISERVNRKCVHRDSDDDSFLAGHQEICAQSPFIYHMWPGIFQRTRNAADASDVSFVVVVVFLVVVFVVVVLIVVVAAVISVVAGAKTTVRCTGTIVCVFFS